MLQENWGETLVAHFDPIVLKILSLGQKYNITKAEACCIVLLMIEQRDLEIDEATTVYFLLEIRSCLTGDC